jgi:hypothetical protein
MCKLAKRALVARPSLARGIGGKGSFLSFAITLAVACCGGAAQGAPEAGRAGPASAKAQKAKTKTSSLPCPRAQWKNDPVCFGENDPEALPMPSAQSGAAVKSGPRRARDLSITPKAGLASSDRQPIYGVDPPPRYNARELSGGIGVGVPF